MNNYAGDVAFHNVTYYSGKLIAIRARVRIVYV